MKTNPQIRAEILRRAGEVMRRKHLALTTERDYCGWIGRYYDYCLDLPKDMPAETKMERFLTHLAVERDVSASTQNGAFHAIRFLYVHVIQKEIDVAKVNALRATRPQHLRPLLEIQPSPPHARQPQPAPRRLKSVNWVNWPTSARFLHFASRTSKRQAFHNRRKVQFSLFQAQKPA